MSDIEKRKEQHIKWAKDPESQINKEPFAGSKLPYKSLPEIDYEQVSTKTTLFNKTMSQPLIIASMTGGVQHGNTINKNLALAAEHTKVAMGVGSQRIALQIEDAIPSFSQVRKHAPSAVIFANMGAIQLNYGKTAEDYKKVVDMIEADGLYIHVNALQEAIQPEGDTNFSGLLKKIETLVKEIKVPIYVKEVGHGFDAGTAMKLASTGVSGIDTAGANGTSWAWIEAKRKGSDNLAEWFKDFGLTLEESLDNIRPYKNKLKIVASGGLRSPIQALKSHLAGADYYSAASPFLEPALESPEKLIQTIEEWQKGLKVAMFCCGIERW